VSPGQASASSLLLARCIIFNLNLIILFPTFKVYPFTVVLFPMMWSQHRRKLICAQSSEFVISYHIIGIRSSHNNDIILFKKIRVTMHSLWPLYFHIDIVLSSCEGGAWTQERSFNQKMNYYPSLRKHVNACVSL
jgi:hypothetical protein